jgi:phage terminase large subunit
MAMATAMVTIIKKDLATSPVFEPLLQPARYKGAWGGRGSGKSHFFASLCVEEHGNQRGRLTVCIREIQKSLKESAKRTIEAQLRLHGLSEADGFCSYADRIATPGDGMIIFVGVQNHTAESLKSLEGYHCAWVEQAEMLSQASFDILRPTIRAKNSELWFSWNPRRRADPVDAFFRQGVMPTNAVCGAYYAASLTAAKGSGRISRCYAEPLLPLKAFWDIGGTGAKADNTVIWIAQFVGREIRMLDYYEAQGQPLATHVQWLRKQKYEDALMVLPHDGAAHDKVHAVSYESELQRAGFETQVVPNQGRAAAAQRIEAARRLFPRIWFNQATTQAGIDALGAYHAKRDEQRLVDLGPEHDWSSHCADAFGMLCIAYEEPVSRPDRPYQHRFHKRSWLSI